MTCNAFLVFMLHLHDILKQSQISQLHTSYLDQESPSWSATSKSLFICLFICLYIYVIYLLNLQLIAGMVQMDSLSLPMDTHLYPESNLWKLCVQSRTMHLLHQSKK